MHRGTDPPGQGTIMLSPAHVKPTAYGLAGGTLLGIGLAVPQHMMDRTKRRSDGVLGTLQSNGWRAGAGAAANLAAPGVLMLASAKLTPWQAALAAASAG